MTLLTRTLAGGLAACLMVRGGPQAYGQGGPRPLENQSAPSGSTSTVQRLSTGDFVMGLVRLDPKRREIFIPCSLNHTNGVIEYLLVNREGKVHESLFKTDARPSAIHTLALLLSTGPSGGTREVEVLVRAEGATNLIRAETLVWDLRREKSMQPGSWSYLGSRMESGRFVAERDGSILAVIADPAALADNPRLGREIDDNWWVNTNSVLTLTGRVDVVFRFP